jgi:hypothetical protein
MFIQVFESIFVTSWICVLLIKCSISINYEIDYESTPSVKQPPRLLNTQSNKSLSDAKLAAWLQELGIENKISREEYKTKEKTCKGCGKVFSEKIKLQMHLGEKKNSRGKYTNVCQINKL